jgi:hypothetical protein
MLDKIQKAEQPIAAANDHLMEQYRRARQQAGAYEALAVEAVLGAVPVTAGQIRYRAVQQQDEAAAGAANSQQGSATAQQGQQNQGKIDANNSAIDGTMIKLGGTRIDPPKPKPEHQNIFQRVEGWVADHTIGEVSKLAQAIEGWLAKTVTRWAIGFAGLNQHELDMAGIDNDFRTDATKDHTTAADSKKTEDEAKKVDPVVAALMKNATEDQQKAIVAMVDLQEWMTAMDDAQTELSQAYSDGVTYVQKAADILRHQIEREISGDVIDIAYIAPALEAATQLARDAASSDDLSQPVANETKRRLESARSAWPDLDIAPGNAAVDAARQRHLQRHRTAAGRGIEGGQRAAAQLRSLINTTNYAGVTAVTHWLDALMAEIDREEIAAAQAFVADLDSIINAHVALIQSSITEQMITVRGTAHGATASD